MRDFPTDATRGRYVNQAPYSCPYVVEQKNSHFYALQSNKDVTLDEGAIKL